MRKASVLIALLRVFGILGIAQDDAQYQTWMKSIPPEVRAIRMAADNAAAAPDATKLADTFDKVSAFWKARNAPDCGGICGNRSHCSQGHRVWIGRQGC